MTTISTMLSRARLDRSIPLRDQIYPLIRDMILTGIIKPGDAIDEKAIAAQLAISRTPVREAVKKLSDEHLVDVVAQSGTRAARIDHAEIEQAFHIRRSLECESAFVAAQHMTGEHAQDLRNILQQQDHALKQRQFVDAIAIDDSFHRAITMVAGLPRLWHMIEISKAHLDRCRHMLVPRPGEAAVTLAEHHSILQALETGNPDTAQNAMRHHLDTSYRKIDLLLKEEPANP